jgi:hypothetical protein
MVIDLKYGQPIWKFVLEAAREIGDRAFTANEIVERVQRKNPAIPTVTIRTYVIAMTPNHPSSIHYVSTRKNHGYFVYFGRGKFKLKECATIDNVSWERRGKKQTAKNHPKDSFLEQNSAVIASWAKENIATLISARKNYSWNSKALAASVEERNLVSREVILSRIKNRGGLDLETLDKVMSWGGFPPFPLRDQVEVLEITREAFGLLDKGDLQNAILRLLSIRGVGISSASKIIGLFDQNRLAIYDSRVGKALKTLKLSDNRNIKCPPGRNRPGDACTYREWAFNYQQLIWILEVIRDYLNKQGYPFNIADVEMALFVMGK